MSTCRQCGEPVPDFRVLLLGGSTFLEFCDERCWDLWHADHPEVAFYALPPLRFED